HYLKGTVFCGQCGSRLIVCNAKSSQGTIYPYFVCGSRHGGRGDCTRQAMLIERVERLVEQFYDHVQISAETKLALSSMLHARFDEMMSEGAAELTDLATRRAQLEDEQEKLLRAHYAGAVPLELLKREQDRITASLETIQNRIDAHHGEYAFARANLDDSLTLLSNAADIYKTADDANRRLCNQALFKAIYVDEDNDVRVGYKTPYDGLSTEGLQADALTWATEAKKMGQVRTSTKGGPLGMSSNLTHLGCLSSTFGNSAPKTKILVSRLDRGVYEVSRRPQDTAPKDDRGPVVRTVETAQTFLTASEVDALVGDYLAGMSVKALAERYGIHRATVFAHLRRRNVPSRRPGLGIDEKAEAVRLARAGVSMRAIGRRMGVDRKAVRAALVEAGLIADESASSS
ncbi:MAG: recombinase zinc beta ribbon domain-containing protein, partial [Acidobacteriota bacterium]|nr:recombinase zinc beta ribbon domain-containing protein [Acidobacteriota bacterium]